MVVTSQCGGLTPTTNNYLNMSWKDVFKDLSEMEGIVQDMDEDTPEAEEDQEIKKGEKSKPKLLSQKSVLGGPDVKTKLLTEILEFHDKKLQLKKVGNEEDSSPVMSESKTVEEIVSLDDQSERFKLFKNKILNDI